MGSLSPREMSSFCIFGKKAIIMKREGEIRIPSGCAISAVISREGRRMTGEAVMKSMIPMHDRSNGLGGGFAAYGIYPDYRDFYAFHIFFDDNATRRRVRSAAQRAALSLCRPSRSPSTSSRRSPTYRSSGATFVSPLPSVLHRLQLDEKEFVARTVMDINTKFKGAYVFSSGKNMGVFKAVGYPGGRRTVLPAGRIRGLLLDGARPLSDEHARLVGRRASVCAARLLGRAQRRDLVLRRQPPLHRNVRLQMHAADRYRGHHLHCRLSAPAAGHDAGGSGATSSPRRSGARSAARCRVRSRTARPICARCFPAF